MTELVKRAQADGLAISGEGRLLAQLIKMVLESSLEGEMDAHLGYAKHDPAGRNGDNSHTGHRAKTVLTEVGPVEIRGAERSGRLVRSYDRAQERQRRLNGIDGMVLSADQARQLRERAAAGERKSVLATEFGISRETVYSYLRAARATG